MQTCRSCVNSQADTENRLMCGMFGCVCSAETAKHCTDYERAPGADEEDSGRVWYAGAWVEGRGD